MYEFSCNRGNVAASLGTHNPLCMSPHHPDAVCTNGTSSRMSRDFILMILIGPSLLSLLATHYDFVRKVFSSNTIQYFSQPLRCSLFAVQLLPFFKRLKGAFLRITSGFFLDDLNMDVWNSQQSSCPAIVVAGGQLRTESLKHCISRYALAPLPI